MNFKILIFLLFYWAIWGLIIVTGGDEIANNGATLGNTTLDNLTGDLSGDETDAGGFFSSGISFGRFFLLALMGVGLSDDTPSFFVILFAVWQSIVSIITVAFIITSIWNG